MCVLLAFAAGVSVITIIGQAKAGGTAMLNPVPDVWMRLGNFCASLTQYAAHIVYPRHLSFHYAYPRELDAVTVVAGATGAAVFSVGVWICRKAHPNVCRGWLFFLVALLPVSGIVSQSGRQAYADRFLYLPMIGIVWMAIELGRRWWISKKRMVMAASCALIAILSWCTVRQIDLWRDEVTLYGHAVAHGGADAFMLGNFGGALLNANRAPEAVVPLKRATELSPERAEHWYNLALAEFKIGNLASSSEFVAKSVGLGSGSEARVLPGRIHLMNRNFDRAIDELTKAAQMGAERRCNEPLYSPPPKAEMVKIISLGPRVRIFTAGR